MDEICLTSHFKLKEMVFSFQAKKHGIKNHPSDEEVKSLRNLCVKVLQPLRDFYGKPIVVSSGFRSRRLNHIVGGSPTSQHTRGEAADLLFPGMSVAIDWMHFIIHHCPYDQLILEHNRRTGAQWLHVSCCIDESKNRKQILFIEAKKNRNIN